MQKVEIEYWDLVEYKEQTLSEIKEPLQLKKMKKCGYILYDGELINLITELDVEDDGNTDIMVIPKSLVIKITKI